MPLVADTVAQVNGLGDNIFLGLGNRFYEGQMVQYHNLTGADVGGLVHRVGQHEAGRRPPGGLGLGPYGGVAVQLGVADDAQERQHQLVEGGHGAVGEDRRSVGVDAGGQLVGDEAADRRPSRPR